VAASRQGNIQSATRFPERNVRNPVLKSEPHEGGRPDLLVEFLPSYCDVGHAPDPARFALARGCGICAFMARLKKANVKPTARRSGGEKEAKSRRKPRPAGTDECLYLGCFFFDDYLNDKEYEGTFQMVVAAATPEQAVERFRKRLRAIQRLGTVLTSPSTVYLQGFVPLDGSFREGVLVNYEARPSPDPPDYQILNMAPEQGIEGLGCFQLADDENDCIQPFVDFGGLAHKKSADAGSDPASGSMTPTARRKRLTPQELEMSRAVAAAERNRKKAEADARRREREAAAEERRKRDNSLKATLAELGPSSKA
jgi:hypothetical protein